MKYIITEEQKDRLIILRRLSELKDLLFNTETFKDPCDFFSLKNYLWGIKRDLKNEIVYIDDFKSVDYNLIWNVVYKIFHNEIVDNYVNNCEDHLI